MYLDLGARDFGSSVSWFMHYYPLDFTEIHAFEVKKDVFQVPAHHTEAEEQLRPLTSASRRVPKSALPIPNFILDRVTSHIKFVDCKDTEDHVDIRRFIKEELGIKPNDALIVKMDIESFEWPVLKDWLADKEMPKLVDELFVEIHYKHESMERFHWLKYNQTREEALDLMVQLRTAGFYAHAWP